MDNIDTNSMIQTYLPVVLGFALKVVGVLFLFWIAVRIAVWAQRRVINALEKRDFDQTLGAFFGSIVRWIIYLGAGLACLGVFGVETTTFAAVIGAASLAIGLAFQGTLGNFAAGVALLVFRPFNVGDVVTISGETGTVAALDLFTTSIDTPDAQRIIMPNGNVFGNTIRNISFHDVRRFDFAVGTDYPASIAEARGIMDAALENLEGRNPEKGHQVVLTALGGSSIDWTIRMWAKSEDYWATKERAIEAVKTALDQAGIGIPYPQMEVHLDGAVNAFGGGEPPKAEASA